MLAGCLDTLQLPLQIFGCRFASDVAPFGVIFGLLDGLESLDVSHCTSESKGQGVKSLMIFREEILHYGKGSETSI